MLAGGEGTDTMADYDVAIRAGATGYEATLVAGEVIRRFDQPTGARPGKLVRGAGYRAAAPVAVG